MTIISMAMASAKGRVNNPIARHTPPTSSSEPINQNNSVAGSSASLWKSSIVALRVPLSTNLRQPCGTSMAPVTKRMNGYARPEMLW